MELVRDTIVFGNSVSAWSAALLATVCALTLATGVKWLAVQRLSLVAKRTSNTLDDSLVEMIRRTQLWLMFFPALYFGVQILDLGAKPDALLKKAAILAMLAQLGLWVVCMVESWLGLGLQRVLRTDSATASSLTAISFVCKLIVWTIVLMMALENLGVNVTALVAGLGVGGIAVALAVQNILGDLFASFSIVIDKPFVIGDFIVVDDYMGTVEKIGIKTTRIRSVDGEQIVFTNGDLLKTRIRNYKRMRERRVLFDFSITYESSADQLARVPGMVKEIIEKMDNTRFERAHFKKFGGSAYEFEVAYWMLQPNFNLYMDTQQAINLEMVRSFEEEEIDFAYQPGTQSTGRHASDSLEKSPVAETHHDQNGKKAVLQSH